VKVEETTNREGEVFAVIAQVVSGSPASEAGLLVNDKLIQFGSLNKSNCPSSLKPIGELVLNSENRTIQLVILRSSQVKYVSVTPKKWNGRGLLG
jgi:26S proteasome non-ATPase regulatory subunit 9